MTVDSTGRDGPGLDISVVLPVYNEAAHLGAELDRITAALQASRYSWEVLVVDDGSEDGSGELALGRDGVRLLRSARNRGSGTARRIGTLAARGRVVVWTDADMTYPNHEIPALVEGLGDADQLVGARTTEQGNAQGGACPGQVGHPPVGVVPGADPHPGPELRLPGHAPAMWPSSSWPSSPKASRASPRSRCRS